MEDIATEERLENLLQELIDPTEDELSEIIEDIEPLRIKAAKKLLPKATNRGLRCIIEHIEPPGPLFIEAAMKMLDQSPSLSDLYFIKQKLTSLVEPLRTEAGMKLLKQIPSLREPYQDLNLIEEITNREIKKKHRELGRECESREGDDKRSNAEIIREMRSLVLRSQAADLG